ncbi:lactate dehydrogenase [Ligilactobacillus sp. WILCCON 0076]|uniref:Lactate dehydrogenase n=1 Tax=Ligilactobacillus ubinensis TaxID=2876789 RepID=A0A9X2FM91_9LACO|nr:NAD(P)-dependent oxidoreductase [Ligilactobacillus ubinensis]MCP0887063.1 lactate dehydrogenase [Ligilactobacillus ubinensis]
MPIIYIVDPMNDIGIEVLKKQGYHIFIRPAGMSIAATQKLVDFSKVYALIIRATKLTTANLTAFTNLKIIARHGVGVDNLPLAAIKEANIRLTYTPGLNASSVAELTLTFCLSLLKQFPVNQLGAFPDGELLQNKTIGLLGYGKIAQRFSELLKPFNVNLLVYNHRPKDLLYGKQTTLSEIAAAADIVSLHIPATTETREIISEDFFHKMKSTAYLINTARGALVNSDSLYLALRDGQIAGAALDVLDAGSTYSLTDFQKLSNIILTPHIGASSIEVLKESSLRCADEILRYAAGKEAIKSYF